MRDRTLAQLDRDIEELAAKYRSVAPANADDSVPANPVNVDLDLAFWDPWLVPKEPEEKISTEE